MILLLDTSKPVCYVTLVDDRNRHEYSWEADRTLAHGLLGYLRDRLSERQLKLGDLSGIGVMKGPGSFTGLRIGATVANTLARELQIPIVGVDGEAWADEALKRLSRADSDDIVIPKYGRAARVTTPKK